MNNINKELTSFFRSSDRIRSSSGRNATNRSDAIPTFANLVRAARSAKGLSVTKAAEQYHCSSQQWRNIESGAQRPSINRLQHLCHVLEIDVSQAFRLWALSGLDPERSQRLAQFLFQEIQAGISCVSREPAVESTVECGPFKQIEPLLSQFDQLTCHTLLKMLPEMGHFLREYRNELIFAGPKAARLKVRTPEQQESLWEVPGLSLVEQCPVAQQKTGLGLFATIFNVPPLTSVFHMAANGAIDRNGVEFSVLLSGSGFAVYQECLESVVQCENLSQGTVTCYPSISNHGFVNVGEANAKVFIVTFPHPGSIKPKEFVEFMNDALPTSELPQKLADAITQILGQ